ncbi:zinc finger, CCHC-type containing protein [Tanacetum coccineum]
MADAAMKHVASNFPKLDKFEGVHFRRWHKKMHFLLSNMSVVGLILNGMSDPLFDIYQNVESSKELWDSLKVINMVEDASSKKFFVSNFTNYKMTDSRPVMVQYNELFGILGRFTQHKMNIDEAIQDNDKPKGNNVDGPLIVNMMEHNNSFRLNIVNNNIASAFMSIFKLNDSILWHARLGHDEALDKFKVFKTKVELQQGSLIKIFKTDMGGEYMDTLYFQSVGIIHEMTAPYTPQQNGISERKNRVLKEMVNSTLAFVRLLDPKLKTLGERGIECIFFGYDEHSKAFRFNVIDPNESVLINSIIESKDAIFDENMFLSVPRPSLVILNGTEDFGGSVVLEKVTEEDDPKTFDEAMKSHDVALWKEAINDEIDFIMGNNTWVLADLPSGCKPLGCKWIFKRKLKVDGTIEKFKARLMDVKTAFLNGELDEDVYMNQPHGFIMHGNENKVDLTKEFLPSRFSMKNRRADVILGGTKVLEENHGLSFGYPLVLEGYTDASWISNTEDNSSTSGWVFLLCGVASKEVEWFRNLILEIPLWSKPITPISILCDSAATLVKAYRQMYNGKSRHLDIRHNMIRELITNGVVSIKFVRSQQNLADHLTDGMARDLVLKSAEWDGFKVQPSR